MGAKFGNSRLKIISIQYVSLNLNEHNWQLVFSTYFDRIRFEIKAKSKGKLELNWENQDKKHFHTVCSAQFKQN